MIWPFSRRPMLADARPLYAALVAEARRPRWYREAGAEDSIDGRFAVLATIMALTDIRLGEGGEEAAALSPRLTEIFVDDMDSQLRQSGLGDPTLGKQVRAMIGMLARRIDSWRAADSLREERMATARMSLYRDQEVSDEVAATGLRFIDEFAGRLGETDDSALVEGALK